MDPSVEHLYDQYMDAAMAGKAEPPEAFLRRHSVSDASLGDALRAVYEEYSRSSSQGENGAAGGSNDPSSSAPDSTGMRKSDLMGDFRIIERLGEGGMGVVFLAEQISLRRQVALKLLRPEVASSATASTRFEREALAAAKLNHPNIVRVIAVGLHRGARYIAMEYIEGKGLDEVLRQAADAGETLAVPRVVRWCSEIARALASAHEHGIIHRDVKPSNIRIAPDDRAMLLDFGVARDLAAAAPTLTETFIGSPFYAAPEQVAAGGGGVDARTDVYSLGLVLYECVTGTMPFAGGTLEQVLQAILTVEPPPPRRCGRSIPRDVDTVVMKAIDKNPARRYGSASELAADLDAILELRPIAARPHGPIERISRWSRRRKPLAAAIATALAAAVVVAALITVQQLQRNQQRASQARALLAEAGLLLEQYAGSRQSTRSAETAYEGSSRNRSAGYMTPEQDATIDAQESAIRRLRREREAMFYRALDLATQAEREGASPDDAEHVRAQAYLERYLETEVYDSIERPMYRDLVLRHDPRGVLDAQLRGSTTIELVIDRPDAQIDVFRRLYDSDMRENGERRLVLSPLRGWPGEVPLGSWGLRILNDAGGLTAGDHIIEIGGEPIRGSTFLLDEYEGVPRGARLRQVDQSPVSDLYTFRALATDPTRHATPRPMRFTAGGREVTISAAIPNGHGSAAEGDRTQPGIRIGDARMLAQIGGVRARVWTGGRLQEMELPTGLKVQTTGAPALCSAASSVPVQEARKLSLEPGKYVFLITAPGMEPQRLAVLASRGSSQRHDIILRPQGFTPDGFVWIPLPPAPPPAPPTPSPETSADHGGSPDGFWIMQREVTFREYYEFLNDPQTLREIDASPRRIRYPYNAEEATGQRDAQGRFLLPDSWEWEWPALHVSWNDAVAYAAWRTRAELARQRRVVFDLPTLDEWMRAAGGAHATGFVFGDRFGPKWCSSCFARPKPWPEPVLSYPIDESPLGVFDMAGSVSEWTRSLWQEQQPHYRHAGGSWATGDAMLFLLGGGNGMLPERDIGFVGFRLVMKPALPATVEPAP